ncbi:CTP synthase [Entomoplasma freundtii]|uniref:CTP synthase n=1 Tax=Entomoplasma freundtii TaxID=74700 RepID=A0A2K8NQJ9_9MOLU|nr:CTP synthase [Entomoplasma freundtii]ATZ16112.1 CTP synthetase [Entomoplasma freundtii]TDY56987.1 CTP synthase [Entomoplasma freundtii]
MAKHVFVTGGVVSGLGKGITASSLGRLLKNSGLNVYMQKFDPYLNVDPGTMSPYQHGEVYVTDDGGETDLDLGHYERFINVNLSKKSSVSAGKIYLEVIDAERRGDWEGKTVQVIPHITDQIKTKIYAMDQEPNIDVIITEIGGTVGDIEAQAFIEALRQVRMEKGRNNVLFLHVGLVPYINASKEYKTKPIQHSIKELLSLGIQPDILVTRSVTPTGPEIKQKISLFGNVPVANVIEAIDVDSIYKVPLAMYEQNLHQIVIDQLELSAKATDMTRWKEFVQDIDNSKEEVEITFVGKYIEMPDAYLSVIEALKMAAWNFKRKLVIKWVQADDLTPQNYKTKLKDSKGILVPGGFGNRGVEGMMLAARYARETNIPYLGICLGMQIAAIEIARNVLNYDHANSTEFNETTAYPVFDFIEGIDRKASGGTLRLGKMTTKLKPHSKTAHLYGKTAIDERHRHRYEFNNQYREDFETKAGVVFAGVYDETKANLVEVMELPQNDFFIGAQFHPEFTSRPNRPNPLFKGFIEAIIKQETKPKLKEKTHA